MMTVGTGESPRSDVTTVLNRCQRVIVETVRRSSMGWFSFRFIT
jgi:hypothetical protein